MCEVYRSIQSDRDVQLLAGYIQINEKLAQDLNNPVSDKEYAPGFCSYIFTFIETTAKKLTGAKLDTVALPMQKGLKERFPTLFNGKYDMFRRSFARYAIIDLKETWGDYLQAGRNPIYEYCCGKDLTNDPSSARTERYIVQPEDACEALKKLDMNDYVQVNSAGQYTLRIERDLFADFKDQVALVQQNKTKPSSESFFTNTSKKPDDTHDEPKTRITPP